jgi:hypothetical protein
MAAAGGAAPLNLAARAQATMDQQGQNNQNAPPKKKSTGAASLDGAIVPLGAMRSSERAKLLGILDGPQCRGPKALVLDPSFSGPLGLVVDVPSLRAHGVEKMFYFAPAAQSIQVPPAAAVPNVVYFVRPKVRFCCVREC